MSVPGGLIPETGLGMNMATNPHLILEAAYNNPAVRRWHKKVADKTGKDQKDILRSWERLIRGAGQEDARTLFNAMSTETIGYHPDDYDWAVHESGVYTPKKESIVINGKMDRAREVYGTSDPAILVNALFGVETPEQLALRTAGTAAPFLAPEVAKIGLWESSMGLEGVVETHFADGGEAVIARGIPLGDRSYPDDPYLSYLDVKPHTGLGLGLAAYSAMDGWMAALGEDRIVLDTIDVGSYVWPLLGFDGDDEDVNLNKEHMEMRVHELEERGDISKDVANEAYERIDDIESLPEIARFSVPTQHGEDEHVGRQTLLSARFEHLQKNLFDNYYLDEVARRRVASLESS